MTSNNCTLYYTCALSSNKYKLQTYYTLLNLHDVYSTTNGWMSVYSYEATFVHIWGAVQLYKFCHVVQNAR